MQKEAIELIQQTAIDAQNIRLPATLENIAVALPKDYALRDLEEFYPNRRRFRGKMNTDSIIDFADHVKNNSGGHGFINSEYMTATVIFNLGTVEAPGHADWKASLVMKKTPAYRALLHTADGECLSQREVIDFIEDWPELFQAYSEGNDGALTPIKLTKAVSAIRKVKIEQKSSSETTQGNFKAERSTLDSVEASSDEGLPDILTFTTPAYFGLPSREFKIRPSIVTGGIAPAIRLRIIGLQQHQEESTQDFKDVLRAAIGDAATMTIGVFTP